MTKPEDPSSDPMKKLLSTLLTEVSSALKKPVCKALVEFDCRSNILSVFRTGQAFRNHADSVILTRRTEEVSFLTISWQDPS